MNPQLLSLKDPGLSRSFLPSGWQTLVNIVAGIILCWMDVSEEEEKEEKENFGDHICGRALSVS